MRSHHTVAYVLIALAVVLEPAPAHGDDVQLWTEAGAAWQRDRIVISFDQGLRFDEDISRVSAVIPELGVRYRIKKWLRAGAAYRLEYERDRMGDMVVRHRFQLDTRARVDLGDVRLGYELKLQEAYRPSSGDQLRATIRNEATVAYDRWKPWRIEAAAELHHDLDQGDAIHLDKVWLTFGGSHRGEARELAVFYRLELPQYDMTDPVAHILGAAIHYDVSSGKR